MANKGVADDIWNLIAKYYMIAGSYLLSFWAQMKKYFLWLYIFIFGHESVAGDLKISQAADVVRIASKIDDKSHLLRGIKLGAESFSGNQVVNFAGAKISSSVWLVEDHVSNLSSEADDATPIKFNGTYIGANHGAYFGVQVPFGDASESHIGSLWNDQEGSRFAIVGVSPGKTSTFLSVIPSEGSTWEYKAIAVGRLTAISNGSWIETSSQRRVQIYPAVRRLSLSIGSELPKAGKSKSVSELNVNEVYDILKPASKESVARMEVTYRFLNAETLVYTKVTALEELHDFSMGGVQAAPLNGPADSLMQKVTGGASLSEWTSMESWTGTQRIPTAGASQMSQKSTDGKQKFGLTVGVSKALINGEPVGPAPVVMISAAKKQYPVAIEPGAGGFSGTLYPGDVAEVYAYRQYWLGDEPPPAK